jgi:hypothetical protein
VSISADWISGWSASSVSMRFAPRSRISRAVIVLPRASPGIDDLEQVHEGSRRRSAWRSRPRDWRARLGHGLGLGGERGLLALVCEERVAIRAGLLDQRRDEAHQEHEHARPPSRTPATGCA